MNAKETLEDLIGQVLAKVSYEWFAQKQSEFVSHPLYDAERDEIVIKNEYSVPDYDDDGEGPSRFSGSIPIEDTQIISEKTYFKSYLPIDETTHWGSFPADIDGRENIKPSNNIDEFASTLTMEAANFTSHTNDIKAIHFFIQNVLNITLEKLSNLKLLHADDVNYIRILNEFYELCVFKMYQKYSREMLLFSGMNILDKLHFSLNQDQLVSLLFILERAGLLNYSDKIPVLNFCLNHFCYINKQKQITTPVSIQILSKKYSDISATQNPRSPTHEKALHQVAEKLKAIIDKLR